MNSCLKVRVALPDDLFSLADLARTTFTQAYGHEINAISLGKHLKDNMSDEVFAQMIEKDLFYVAHENSDLVGFVQVGTVNADYRQYLDPFEQTASEIRRLYILADHQCKGLGSALLTRGLQEITSASCTYLTTWESNHRAQKLYRRFGFSRVGQIPEYGCNGELNGYEHIMVRPASLA